MHHGVHLVWLRWSPLGSTLAAKRRALPCAVRNDRFCTPWQRSLASQQPEAHAPTLTAAGIDGGIALVDARNGADDGTFHVAARCRPGSRCVDLPIPAMTIKVHDMVPRQRFNAEVVAFSVDRTRAPRLRSPTSWRAATWQLPGAGVVRGLKIGLEAR